MAIASTSSKVAVAIGAFDPYDGHGFGIQQKAGVLKNT
jgi:hypothetical protein